jgi:hypothetical protein
MSSSLFWALIPARSQAVTTSDQSTLTGRSSMEQRMVYPKMSIRTAPTETSLELSFCYLRFFYSIIFI